jgi:hypothetical protein
MTSPEAIDLNFVTTDVTGGTWLQWATNITNITDLVDKAIAQASGPPRKCIRRLVIAAHGAERTDGFTVFDANTAGMEYIDGGNSRSPLGPNVEAQLQRLRPYFCTEAIVELRVCRMGTGQNGERAMQLVADIVGVPVTAPTDSISSLAAIGGLATSWRMVYPADWGKQNDVSFWRGDPESKPPPPPAPRPAVEGVAPITGQTVTGQYVPLPGVNPPSLTPPATLPTPPRGGIGGKVAAGAAAGLLAIGAGAALLLNGGGASPAGSPTSTPVSGGAAQTAPPPAAAPAAVVRVSPIEAVFNQAAFTTTYQVLVTIDPPGAQAGGISFSWAGADCGQFGEDRLDGRIYRWVHPHPPCDVTTDHRDRTITLRVFIASGEAYRCTYQGSASGVGPPCVDVRTGATTTPVGGGR